MHIWVSHRCRLWGYIPLLWDDCVTRNLFILWVLLFQIIVQNVALLKNVPRRYISASVICYAQQITDLLTFTYNESILLIIYRVLVARGRQESSFLQRTRRWRVTPDYWVVYNAHELVPLVWRQSSEWRSCNRIQETAVRWSPMDILLNERSRIRNNNYFKTSDRHHRPLHCHNRLTTCLPLLTGRAVLSRLKMQQIK